MTSRQRETGARRGSGGGGRPGAGRGDRPGADDRPPAFGLGIANLLLLAAAAAAIIGGYVLLDRGSITAAPILLVLGYVVLVPAGLLVGSRRRDGRPPRDG